MEEWRNIPNASLYEVSSLGRARRCGACYFLKGSPVQGSMGYLRITVTMDTGERRAVYLHRSVLTAFTGRVPEGLLALHRDGDINNCALSNLYWGTHQDNANDRVAHGRSGVGEENPNAKLGPAQVLEIRRRYVAGGATQQEIAEDFGVTQTHVWRLLRGDNWRHI